MPYQYKTVPAPKVLSIKTEKETAAAINGFGDLLNQEAVDGWEFHSMQTITVSEAQGCSGSGQAKVTHYNMLVFHRLMQ